MPGAIPIITGGLKGASGSLGAKFLSGLGGAAGSIIGGLFGRSGQSDANRTNLRIARENREFQREMSSTAYQRATKDLEAAGLNRILALGSPASTPAGNVATMQNENQILSEGLREGSSKAIAAITAKQQLHNMRAQERLTRQQQAQTLETQLRTAEEAKARELENRLLQQKIDVYEKHPWLMESETLLGGSTASTLFNSARGAIGILKGRRAAAEAARNRHRVTTTTNIDKHGVIKGRQIRSTN